MTNVQTISLVAAEQCIAKGLALLATPKTSEPGIKESNIRHSFTSYLRLIFPDEPWWVEDHISRGEANSAFSVDGEVKKGFADNLVGLTVIEYESNLLDKTKFNVGLLQVRNYCASLVNKGHDPDLVLGVLSDTIRWRAYRIAEILPATTLLGGEHIVLEEMEAVDLSAGGEVAAKRLISFLERYLGRRGSRPLAAHTIAKDLGLESRFFDEHAGALNVLVDTALATNPKYAAVVSKLWTRFVTYLQEGGKDFQPSGYADELYILTLAKLLCANIVERTALTGSDDEIAAILDGRYFHSKGLVNLVEYDYFGWLNHAPYISDIVPVARGMQADLEAYDFASPAAEDLFGRMMSQLAKRTQRLLLGQEWTPSWLASHVVGRVLDRLPKDADPQLVDMCCGSGAMVVETIKRTKMRISELSAPVDPGTRVKKLAQAITGFDIDPLAVLLAKINWVVAARDWLNEATGIAVSIPIYHADSLFAITPLSDSIADALGSDIHKLRIAEYEVDLPTFLLSASSQPLFDALLDRAYSMALSGAAPNAQDIRTALETASIEADCATISGQEGLLEEFLARLIVVIDALSRDGRNGIWIFVLRNSYRPGLVAGQFNGLVSNPPWLALSKVADNPYRDLLRHHANAYGIKPGAQSHLHIELATIFLLHAVDRYLALGAEVGCILPDTVLNGHHHNPFRRAEYASVVPPIALAIDEIWRVGKGTFKNEACVLFGKKIAPAAEHPSPIPGARAEEAGLSKLSFERVERGNRVIWTDSASSLKENEGFFQPAQFRQGADVMPRTLLFHEILPSAMTGVASVKSIDVSTSPLAFVIKDAKVNRGFKITSRSVPERIVFDVLTSNLLTPYRIEKPLKALLPIERATNGDWVAMSAASLAATPQAKAAFDEILSAYGSGKTIPDLVAAIESDRRKLTQQRIPIEGYLILTGAGGTLVCSAYAPISTYNLNKLVIDQTLYWAVVPTEDEAIYLAGLFNSEAINSVIKDFQPRGAFGERHIHKLAPGATPKFSASEPSHQAVVTNTKALIASYQTALAANPKLAALLNPNASSLASRRRRLRAALQGLPQYGAYEIACEGLYGV